MQQYLDLLRHVRTHGHLDTNRTGIPAYSVFGGQMQFDLTAGFPLMTTKKLHLKSIIYELLWFLRGDTNIAYLREHGVRIWDRWADENGDLGPIYGHQWRSWTCADGSTIDQLDQLLETIKTDPCSRRLLVNAWNVGELDKMALAPCHCLFQFHVQAGVLSCQIYQRSADLFLGVPFNIASYALLTHLIAHVCDLKPGVFIHTFGNLHIYANHVEQVEEQMTRTPMPLSRLELNPAKRDLFAITYDDIAVHNYHAHAHIQAPIAV